MTLTAFENDALIGSGSVAQIAAACQVAEQRGGRLVVIDDDSGRTVDLDLRGTPGDVAQRHDPPRRGRPRLGVTAREVTLLPRHWDWLGRQRGGASGALRRMVDAAMADAGADPRAAQDAAYRAATTLAGDRPGYEEAMRALYAGELGLLEARTEAWPADIRAFVLRLAYGEERRDAASRP